jgi:hypothetical protein
MNKQWVKPSDEWSNHLNRSGVAGAKCIHHMQIDLPLIG